LVGLKALVENWMLRLNMCIVSLASENNGLRFKVALRSDVYYLARTSDESTDKIEGSVVWCTWTNHEILVMLIKRILTFNHQQADYRQLLKSDQFHLSTYLNFKKGTVLVWLRGRQLVIFGLATVAQRQ